MINKLLTILLTALMSFTAIAQERKPLQGRVLIEGVPSFGIFVINKATGAEVKSAANGDFSIPAKPGDKLAVYSTGINVREFAISEQSFKDKPYVIEVNAKATELDEVVINDMDERQMGLAPANQKRYTPAERRLKTARSGMGIDQLINLLSGRMRMLKKAVETERKEQIMDNIDGVLSDDDLVNIGVPRDLARGFLFYAVEDPRVGDAIKDGNADLLKLLLMEISEKYNKLQDQHE